jgi:hypothetical protein
MLVTDHSNGRIILSDILPLAVYNVCSVAVCVNDEEIFGTVSKVN